MSNASGQSAVDHTLRQAAAALQSGRTIDAERLARDARTQAPGHAGALQLHGMTLLGLGRHEDAVAPLQDAVRINPGAPAETYLAMALRGMGRTADATTLLRRAVERKPPFPNAYFELGTLLHAERKLDEAETILRQGVNLAPGVPAFPLALANVLFDRGDQENAKKAFVNALAAAPRLTSALEGLGSILMAQGTFKDAAARFRELLAIDSGNAKVRLLLASCLLELGQAEESRTILTNVVAASPELFGQALKAQTETGRGRLWLKPSVAARFLDLRRD